LDGIKHAAANLRLAKRYNRPVCFLRVGVETLDQLVDRQLQRSLVIYFDHCFPGWRRQNWAIERQRHFSTEGAGQIVAQIQTNFGIWGSQSLAEVAVGRPDGAEN